MGIETILYCFIADEEMFSVGERFAGAELVGTLAAAQQKHEHWKAKKEARAEARKQPVPLILTLSCLCCLSLLIFCPYRAAVAAMARGRRSQPRQLRARSTSKLPLRMHRLQSPRSRRGTTTCCDHRCRELGWEVELAVFYCRQFAYSFGISIDLN